MRVPLDKPWQNAAVHPVRRLLARHRFERKLHRLHFAHSRCKCGALYAYDAREKPRPTAWDCSDIILGLAVPKGQPGSVTHGDTMPFVFWKVKEAPRDWALEYRRVAASPQVGNDG